MQNAFKIILETSIYSSIMIAFVLLVKSFLSGKLSTRLMSLLWIAVLIRLAMPITLESPVHLISLTPAASTVASNITNEDVTIADNANVGLIDNIDYSPINNSENEPASLANDSQKDSIFQKAKSIIAGISLWSVAFIIWAIGAVFVFTKSVARNFAFRKKITTTNVISPSLEEKLLQAKNILNINKDIKITESKYANIPFVYGYLKPIILLPIGFSHSITSKKLSLIILHELCHVKRGDILKNFCWLIVKALHWFNPLVQISYKSYLENIEEVCDEVVLSHLSKRNKYEYGQSLIDIVRLSKNKYDLPLSVSFCNKKTTIRKRVIKIMNPQKKSKTIGIITLLVSIAMIFACFTTACQPKAAIKEDTDDSPTINTEEQIPEANQQPSDEESSGDTETDILAATSKTDGIAVIEKLNLAEIDSIDYAQSEDYFGDKILYYHCNEGAESASYRILESDLSLVSYENKAVDMTLPIELSEDELKVKATEYAKSIWAYENIEIISCESSSLGPNEEYPYFGAEGVMGEAKRPFIIDLNGKGELRGASSYPQDVDLSKGVQIEEAREIALELLREQGHIVDENNLTLINETLTDEYYTPMYIFSYEYRSDNPTAEEYDYEGEVKVVAATGVTMGAGIEPITSDIDVYTIDEAEQMAKEYIASEKELDISKLVTTEKYSNAHGEDGIMYSFFFDYNSEYAYSLMMTANGEFWDIAGGSIE